MAKQIFKLVVFLAACLAGMIASEFSLEPVRSRFVGENNYENLGEYIVRKLVEE